MAPAPGVSEVVRGELNPGEKLLWCGAPELGPFIREATNWIAVPAAFPVAGFGLYWTWMPLREWLGYGSLLFFLFGSLVLSISVAMASAPLWSRRKATRTLYAVTDRRLMVISRTRGRTTASYHPQDLGVVERRDAADGVGSVVFNVVRERDEDGNPFITDEHGFFSIANVRQVERLVLDLKRHGAAPGDR
jgi:hypothetical protein